MTLHRGLGFELPPAIAGLHAFLAAGRGDSRKNTVEYALGIGYPAKWIGKPRSADLSPAAVADELGYTAHPFEIVPFAWKGGDALQYAMLVHAAELGPRWPMISYAPSDSGPRWLGDDARHALANLMGVSLRQARRELTTRDEREDLARVVAHIGALGRALHIAPSKSVRNLTEGARSRRPPALVVPKGWRWIPGPRGMGTLAPSALFDPALGKHVLPDWPDAGTELARARTELKRGFPGSALAIARNVYAECWDEGTLAAAEVMREAYAALGRQFLVARVDAYLAMQKAQIEDKRKSRGIWSRRKKR
jgi:hypothetical protein